MDIMGLKTAKATLKNKIVGLTVHGFKTYYTATVIKSV